MMGPNLCSSWSCLYSMTLVEEMVLVSYFLSSPYGDDCHLVTEDNCWMAATQSLRILLGKDELKHALQ